MKSVKEIVETKLSKKAEEQRQRERKQKQKEAREKRNTFNREVSKIIQMFSNTMFNINSSNEEVAKAVLDKQRKLCHADFHLKVCCLDDPMEDIGSWEISITKSKKYREWKKALEDKFGVDIYITKARRYEERDGGSQPDNVYYCGINGSAYIKEK